MNSFFHIFPGVFLASGLGVSSRFQDYIPMLLFLTVVVVSALLFGKLNRSR